MYDDWSHISARETKSRKKTQNPSFSSSLLDEIYRSMNAGDEKSGEFKHWEGKDSCKRSGGGGGVKACSLVEDEGIATLRRAFLVQKWMDMKLNVKNFTHQSRASSSFSVSDQKPATDDDSFWSSSDSVSRWSERPSCFGPFRSKSTKGDVFPEKHHQMKSDYRINDNYTSRIDQINLNTKKVKQPLSPGGRLTTFLNSLFTNRSRKKPKDLSIERTSKSTHGSTCSSASSFTRSCLSKNSPRSREKLNNGIRRTVRFYPVSVIIDEDCRPCGEKSIFGEQDLMNVHVTTMSKDKYDDNDDEEDDDDDDFESDASSDLFELDHLSILKECDELPVYGTTNFGTNCAIANGLIC
ncbi:hypothetical protein R6Q59_018268 [Mikania micrantha]|uniref:Protein BIG GRAIN 1-like B n=1 Tax=Mikania micrantha TaxID=192012 RepID=A0A5N6LHF0_9ASTR|nr:hypothetical protein E3N88_42548 [Mikania micrantha]